MTGIILHCINTSHVETTTMLNLLGGHIDNKSSNYTLNIFKLSKKKYLWEMFLFCQSYILLSLVYK